MQVYLSAVFLAKYKMVISMGDALDESTTGDASLSEREAIDHSFCMHIHR